MDQLMADLERNENFMEFSPIPMNMMINPFPSRSTSRAKLSEMTPVTSVSSPSPSQSQSSQVSRNSRVSRVSEKSPPKASRGRGRGRGKGRIVELV